MRLCSLELAVSDSSSRGCLNSSITSGWQLDEWRLALGSSICSLFSYSRSWSLICCCNKKIPVTITEAFPGSGMKRAELCRHLPRSSSGLKSSPCLDASFLRPRENGPEGWRMTMAPRALDQMKHGHSHPEETIRARCQGCKGCACSQRRQDA